MKNLTEKSEAPAKIGTKSPADFADSTDFLLKNLFPN